MDPGIETFECRRITATLPGKEARLRGSRFRGGRRHLALPVMLVWLLTTALTGVASAAGGDLDPTFGLDGKVTTKRAELALDPRSGMPSGARPS